MYQHFHRRKAVEKTQQFPNKFERTQTIQKNFRRTAELD